MKIEAARRGGALVRPSPLGVIWWIMAVLLVLYALNQIAGLGGKTFEHWINNVLLWTAVVLCLLGALRTPRSRPAWLLITVAIASWATGSTIWSIRFGDSVAPPLTSVSDVFWLAWYPIIGAALVLLERDSVRRFDIHRLIDGVAVMLVVATPWTALLLQPVLEHSSGSTLAKALNFVYPLADAVLVGVALGTYALTAWHPGRMWLIIGIALTSMGLGDAIYSVLSAGHVHDRGVYDVAWVAGAVVLAYGAWQPHPGPMESRTVTGWPAIALPLAIQVIGAGIQFYAFFREIPNSERLLTVLVMLIAAFQIIITRPRPEPRPADSAGGSSLAGLGAGPPADEGMSGDDGRGVHYSSSGPDRRSDV